MKFLTVLELQASETNSFLFSNKLTVIPFEAKNSKSSGL